METVAELRSKTVEELQQELEATEAKLYNLKFAHAISPIENPMSIRETRRYVAKLNTTLHEKTIEIVEGKVKSGELTEENVRAFLEAHNNHLPTPINLAKLKKIIANVAK